MQGAKETARGESERGDCSCIDRLLEQSIDTEQQQQQQIALMSHAGSCWQHTRLQVAMNGQGKRGEGGGAANFNGAAHKLNTRVRPGHRSSEGYASKSIQNSPVSVLAFPPAIDKNLKMLASLSGTHTQVFSTLLLLLLHLLHLLVLLLLLLLHVHHKFMPY